MSERARHRLNPHLQWEVPPVDPTRLGRPVIESLSPAAWSTQVSEAFDRVARSRVSRILIRHLRKRTTVYHTEGSPQAFPDEYEGRHARGPEPRMEVMARAETVGTHAVIMVNVTRPYGAPARGELPRSLEISLTHELVHAVNVTWGNYRKWQQYTLEENARVRADSPEEVMAWIVENMHRSEMRLPLRSNYNDALPLPATRPPTSRSTRTPLSELEWRTVDRCRWRVASLASALGELPRNVCPYNPFRAVDGLSTRSGGMDSR